MNSTVGPDGIINLYNQTQETGNLQNRHLDISSSTLCANNKIISEIAFKCTAHHVYYAEGISSGN
jgi:hypothetical protein